MSKPCKHPCYYYRSTGYCPKLVGNQCYYQKENTNEMRNYDIAKSNLTGCYYFVMNGEKYDITEWVEKHDKEIRDGVYKDMENKIPLVAKLIDNVTEDLK